MFILIDELLKYCVYYIRRNLISVVFLLVVFSLTTFILFTVVSYYVYKWLQIGLDQNNLFFYKYNKKSQQMLNKYGDCPIESMYLVRQPFAPIIDFVINVFTLGQYNKMILASPDSYPQHSLLIFKVRLDNGLSKLLLLEKNNCINLTDNFVVHGRQDIKMIRFKHKAHTLKSALDETEHRIGAKKFYNWNLCKNNCHEFTKEMLVSLGKLTKKNKEYIERDKMLHIINPSDFTIHLVNSICIVYNIVEKYILDSQLF